MLVREFLDTNVLVYVFALNDARKPIALELMVRGAYIGVQSLNEFTNVQRKKLRLPWAEVLARLRFLGTLCPAPVPVTQSVHFRGLEIAHKHGYHIYDALLLAAAIESSCTVFYSEDMHDGQVIDGLTIRNPFATA